MLKQKDPFWHILAHYRESTRLYKGRRGANEAIIYYENTPSGPN